MLFFSTGKTELDQVLGGGIAGGWITAIRGQTGSGKTMMLDSILSKNPSPVMHFLTETKEPKYVSVSKENYSFMATQSADDIKDKIASLWMNGFGGIIAIDSIEHLDVGGDKGHRGMQARLLKEWLRWFVSRTPQHPEETRLGHNVCSMIFTKMTQRQTMGESFSKTEWIMDSAAGISHLSSQQIDVKIDPESSKIQALVSRNRFYPPAKVPCTFSVGKRGIE